MVKKEAPVADVKARLSEYLSLSSSQRIRIVITRRGKPVAALVSIEDLQILSQVEQRKGLAEIAGKWEHFEDVSKSIQNAYRERGLNDHRHVPL